MCDNVNYISVSDLCLMYCFICTTPEKVFFFFFTYFTKYNLALFILLKCAVVYALLSYKMILMLGMKNRLIYCFVVSFCHCSFHKFLFQL